MIPTKTLETEDDISEILHMHFRLLKKWFTNSKKNQLIKLNGSVNTTQLLQNRIKTDFLIDFLKKEKNVIKFYFELFALKNLAFVLLYLIFLTPNMNPENIFIVVCKLKLMSLYLLLLNIKKDKDSPQIIIF